MEEWELSNLLVEKTSEVLPAQTCFAEILAPKVFSTADDNNEHLWIPQVGVTEENGVDDIENSKPVLKRQSGAEGANKRWKNSNRCSESSADSEDGFEREPASNKSRRRSKVYLKFDFKDGLVSKKQRVSFKCQFCGKILKSKGGEKLHMKVHSFEMYLIESRKAPSYEANAALMCPFGELKVPNLPESREQVNDKHELRKKETLNMDFYGDGTAKSKECNPKFKTRSISILQNHKISHLASSKFIMCKLCSKRLSGEKYLVDHLKECHNIEVNMAKFVYDTPKDTKLNILYGENKISLCPFCGEEFPDAAEWREHLNEAHEFHNREILNMTYVDDKIAKCNECQIELDAQKIWGLELHKFQHLPYSLHIKCKLCCVLFASGQPLLHHLELCHADQL